MGPKKLIFLAAVSGVRETNHNRSVLFKLTKLNEIEYKLSEDLKLINITVGIGTYSSKFPCPYGECEKDRDGHWTKGKPRTIRNICDNRIEWMNKSRRMIKWNCMQKLSILIQIIRKSMRIKLPQNMCDVINQTDNTFTLKSQI